jgi:predicted GNAT superfamily acetyltransferase
MPTESSRSSLHVLPGGAAAAAADVQLRELASVADYHACVAVQNEVWGATGSGHAVPASLLLASSKVGGLAIGAFDGDGGMLGFVFGLAGVKDGEAVHWSHMLAVRAAARGHGLGRMLKEAQRAELARRGVPHIYWTFDPLQARNAHLNLNLLGARVVDYVSDMYGASASPLHFGLATDRLVVSYTTDRAPRPARPATPAARASVLTPFPRPGDAAPGNGEMLLIEIPTDLEDGDVATSQAMSAWRIATREAFQLALQRGHEITSLLRDRSTGRSFYVAEKDARDTQSHGK